MSHAKNMGTTWDATPHTIAKIEILRRYLTSWFLIFGRTWGGAPLIYVDGFAGPGTYNNHRFGSPLVALQSAEAAIQKNGDWWKAGNIYCVFIEEDKRRFENLNAELGQLTLPDRIQVIPINATFAEGYPQAVSIIGREVVRRNPQFAFADPFGAKGIPFSLIRSILEDERSEVLVNLDADGINRIFKAGDISNHTKILNSVFGYEGWVGRLSNKLENADRCAEVLAIYKEKLKEIPAARYRFSFEMRSTAQHLEYFLVFASRHRKGLEKMKEAMNAMDQDGNYTFCDATQHQPMLFRGDDPEDWVERFVSAIGPGVRTMDEVSDYILSETPFRSPVKLLNCAERKGLIKVISSNPKRRRGSYKPADIQSIQFNGSHQ